MVRYMDNQVGGFKQFSEMKEGSAGSRFGVFGWVLLFLLAWWLFMPQKKNPVAPAAEVAPPVDISKVPKQSAFHDKLDFTIQGIRISNIVLKEYKEDMNGSNPVKLLAGVDDKEFVEVGIQAVGTDAPSEASLWKSGRAAANNVMSWKSESGVEFFRKISVSDGFVIIVSDEIKNNSKKPISVRQYSRVVQGGGASTLFTVHVGGIAKIDDGIEERSWDDMSDKAGYFEQGSDQTPFAGFSDQYWQVIASSEQQGEKTIRLRRRADGMYQAEIAPAYGEMKPGEVKEIATNIFAGPKTQAALRDAALKMPGIDRTLDYGWFGFLSRPFLWTLNRLYDFIPNYGIAIILLTIIIRGLMWPLSKKSFKGMAAMQEIQPEMARIQKLYGDDKARMQSEILRLYQTHKANPLSSIGIMFLQIPIFFALYKALIIAVPLRHAGFLWMSDLSVRDPYFILPLLMAATMFLQNKMTSAGRAADAPGAKMMKYMPWIFAALFAWMPGGLVLYWTVSNICGIIQIAVIKKGEKREKI
ncbi:MAG: membrane protein insertase YidC [Rickettsiales bacterium]|jgi:YidC/Oxa1 family membrane protein insertase|nr:membrane protein insertase YidC [Rickettsiales bacterium]